MSDNKKKNEPVAQEPSEGTNANAKNNTPNNNKAKNNTPNNNASKNNKPKNNAPTGDLNAKIKDILPLLTKIGELQDKYASASDEEKGTIEKEFEDSKKQAIELQTEINKTLETMTLDKNVIAYFQNSYPDYLKSLKNLNVLNSANKKNTSVKNGNANAKNGNANAKNGNANAKNGNGNANAKNGNTNNANANNNSNMNTNDNTNSNMNTSSSNNNNNEKNVGEPPIVAEENKLERGTGSRNLTKNNKKNEKNEKKNQKGGKRRTRRNRKN